MSTTGSSDQANLKATWAKLIEERGALPLRMAAEILNVKEAELLDARRDENIRRLTNDYGEILKAAQGLGQIMTLVRNDFFVTMPVGHFETVAIDGTHGRMAGGPIDIDFDLAGWGSAYSIVEESHGAVRRNIQFMDKAGDATVKIVLWSKDADDKFDQLVDRYAEAAPNALDLESSDDAGWMSFDTPPGAVTFSDHLSPRLQALFQACVDEKVEIELRVPTRASAETYRGPLRAMEPRDEEGTWIDLRYPHFTSHFFVGQVSHGVAWDDDETTSHLLTVIDKQGRVVCTAKLPKGSSDTLDQAWLRTIAETWKPA